MTSVLQMSALGGVALTITILLVVMPASRLELRVWHTVRVTHLRRWLTRNRQVVEPFHRETTLRIARRNLRWHLVLTALFSFQLGVASASTEAWWRPLPLLLLVPCVAYMLGSLVQRQKIAIIGVRIRDAAARTARGGEGRR